MLSLVLEHRGQARVTGNLGPKAKVTLGLWLIERIRSDERSDGERRLDAGRAGCGPRFYRF